jgi:hypothetical protein
MHNAGSHNSPLLQQQLAFSASIRDPLNHPVVTGVAAERMTLYRELFYNNFSETLASAFPILQQVLEADYWQQLCQEFFAQYHCATPYLSHMPGEFVVYLQQINTSEPPWLLELATWEWTELELMLAPDADVPDLLDDDVLHAIPVLSPLLRLHAFGFPVHKICATCLPAMPDVQHNYLAAWRKPDDEIAFVQVNAFSYRLLQLLMTNRQHTGLELLNRIAGEQTAYEAAVIVRGGIEILQSFRQKNILLGSLPVNKGKTYE